MIYKKGDYIFVQSKVNRYYDNVLVCTFSDADQAEFEPYDKEGVPIFLSQHKSALISIKGVFITKEDNPEYFL